MTEVTVLGKVLPTAPLKTEYQRIVKHVIACHMIKTKTWLRLIFILGFR